MNDILEVVRSEIESQDTQLYLKDAIIRIKELIEENMKDADSEVLASIGSIHAFALSLYIEFKRKNKNIEKICMMYKELCIAQSKMFNIVMKTRSPEWVRDALQTLSFVSLCYAKIATSQN